MVRNYSRNTTAGAILCRDCEDRTKRGDKRWLHVFEHFGDLVSPAEQALHLEQNENQNIDLKSYYYFAISHKITAIKLLVVLIV